MSIRFAAAAASSPLSARMPRERVRDYRPLAANDDRLPVSQTHMHAALKHFAEHGLAAADHARHQALKAARAGDRQTFDWWLEICRALDRRMAKKAGTAADSSA